MSSQSKIICNRDFFAVDVNTGEVLGDCYELGLAQIDDVVEDHDLEHYSVTPPVPAVITKYKENMKKYNKWYKGKEKYIQEAIRFTKKINYLRKKARRG